MAINVGQNNLNVKVKQIRFHHLVNGIQTITNCKEVDLGKQSTQTNINVWNAYDAQGYAYVGSIGTDGSISFPQTTYSYSIPETFWIHLHFDTPIPVTVNDEIIALNVTQYFAGYSTPWRIYYRVYPTYAIDTNNIILFGTSSFPTTSSYITEKISLTGEKAGNYQDFYIAVTTNPGTNYDVTISITGAAGCMTLKGNQLKEVELI